MLSGMESIKNINPVKEISPAIGGGYKERLKFLVRLWMFQPPKISIKGVLKKI